MVRKCVFGYIVSEKWLLRRGLEKQLGTGESAAARDSTILRTISNVLAEAQFSGDAKWMGVKIKDDILMCIALATNDPTDFMLTKPPREEIENLKKVLNTEKEPRWYPYA